MPYDELQKWYLYFDERPPGWKEDARQVPLIQAFGGKVDGEKIFESLAHMKRKREAARKVSQPAGTISTASLMNSAFFSKIIGELPIGKDATNESNPQGSASNVKSS